jgi:thiol-disulfide isomerase/thioredoxin
MLLREPGNGTLEVFLARSLEHGEQANDCRLVFVDVSGKRHVMPHNARSASGGLMGVLYVSSADCPADRIRQIVVERVSTPDLRAEQILRGIKEKQWAAEVKEALKDSPFPKPLVGRPYVFFVKDINGKQLDSEMYKGKVLLLDFWSTWCGPCVDEMPKLKKLYDRYHERGLEILGISWDRDLVKLQEFIRKHEIPWPQVRLADDLARTAVREVAGVEYVPRYFVIDREGKVETTKARHTMEEVISRLLAGD